MKKKSIRSKLKKMNAITAMDINQDRNLIAIGQQSNKQSEPILSIFSLDLLEPICVVESYNGNYIPAISFNKEGTRLFYSTDNDKVFMFDCVGLKKTDWFIACEKNRKLVISSKGDKLISSGTNLEVWDINEEKKIWTNTNYKAFEICNEIDYPIKSSWSNNQEFSISFPFIKESLSACFVDGDQSIIFCGGNEPQVYSVNLNTLEKKVFFNRGVFQSREMRLSLDEEFIFISSFIPNGDFIWNLKTNKRVLDNLFNEKYGSSPAFEFHPSKRILAVGTSVGYVSVINLDTGDYLFSERLHTAGIYNLKFYPDGSKIISGGHDGRVLITGISELLDKHNS